jgi:hypothetical protein
MSRGRHSRPGARGGGLASLLAVALAGGAVAIGFASPSTATLRLCVIGGAVVGAIGLLLLARLQRVSSRAQARTEDRLRSLEVRSRDESAELHRRVIEAVTREGELRTAVDTLTDEIARLRAVLDGLVAPVGAAVATIAERVAQPATYDLPLMQRAFAEADDTEAPVLVDAEPPAGVLWQPAQRPEAVPAPAVAASAAAALAAQATTATGERSWVVREIDVSEQSEPVAALTMRILDLRTPMRVDEDEDAEPAATGAGWTSFARPA